MEEDVDIDKMMEKQAMKRAKKAKEGEERRARQKAQRDSEKEGQTELEQRKAEGRAEEAEETALAKQKRKETRANETQSEKDGRERLERKQKRMENNEMMMEERGIIAGAMEPKKRTDDKAFASMKTSDLLRIGGDGELCSESSDDAPVCAPEEPFAEKYYDEINSLYIDPNQFASAPPSEAAGDGGGADEVSSPEARGVAGIGADATAAAPQTGVFAAEHGLKLVDVGEAFPSEKLPLPGGTTNGDEQLRGIREESEAEEEDSEEEGSGEDESGSEEQEDEFRFHYSQKKKLEETGEVIEEVTHVNVRGVSKEASIASSTPSKDDEDLDAYFAYEQEQSGVNVLPVVWSTE